MSGETGGAMDERLALTVSQAARALQISTPQAYRMAADGRLPTVKLGPRLPRVPLDVLRAQLAAASTPGADAHPE
jgi:excisionase family DNA binding protein